MRPDVPPFLVADGTNDSLLLVEDTRRTSSLRCEPPRGPAAYAELPGGQHAFDGFQSVRCGHVINGMERFTVWVRSTCRRAPMSPLQQADRRTHGDEHEDAAQDRHDGPGL